MVTHQVSLCGTQPQESQLLLVQVPAYPHHALPCPKLSIGCSTVLQSGKVILPRLEKLAAADKSLCPEAFIAVESNV